MQTSVAGLGSWVCLRSERRMVIAGRDEREANVDVKFAPSRALSGDESAP